MYYGDGSIQDNIAYIQTNLKDGGKVYILGGTSAVSQAAESALINAGVALVRLSGNNRYDTNLKILQEAGVNNEEILICTGLEYADSLSASATGLPILMVNAARNALMEGQINFLREHANNKFTIIGGTGAISEKLEADIEAIVGNVDRVFGKGREATSVAVAERYFGNSKYVFMAYSRNFPDGLCGGPVAYAHGVPLLLVNAKQESHAREFVKKNGIMNGYIMGGTAVLNDAIVSAVFNCTCWPGYTADVPTTPTPGHKPSNPPSGPSQQPDEPPIFENRPVIPER